MIRSIDITDNQVAARVVTIQRAAYAIEAELMGFGGIPPLHESPRDIQAFAHLTWMGAFQNDVLVGIIAWQSQVHADNGDAVEIDRLAVHPDWARQGHGRALVRAVPYADVTDVSTGTLNEPAIRLYESEGFVQLASTEVAPRIFTTQFRRVASS